MQQSRGEERGAGNSRNNENNCIIKVLIVVLDVVLGHLGLVRHNTQCPCFPVVPEATQETRSSARNGCSKSSSPDRDKGVAERNGRE